jgi:hypothetical protein
LRGASTIWIDALKAISPVLEKADRATEATKYRKKYYQLCPASVSSISH